MITRFEGGPLHGKEGETSDAAATKLHAKTDSLYLRSRVIQARVPPGPKGASVDVAVVYRFVPDAEHRTVKKAPDREVIREFAMTDDSTQHYRRTL